MNQFLFYFVFSPLFVFGQFTYVPDDNFEQELINLGVDSVFDDYVETSGIDTITFLYVGNHNISDLTGIEDFNSLQTLYCNDNQLTSLDLSSNTMLFELNCSVNHLVSLDVRNGNNHGLLYFSAMNNQFLNCIDVDEVAWANSNWSKDSWAQFSVNCNPSLIQDHNTYKKLIKVLDVFGRNVLPRSNMPLFYIYSDGTVVKRIILD